MSQSSSPPPSTAKRFLNLATVVQASARQASCEVHGEVVILHVEQGTYYGVEQVGARIWQLLQEPRALLEIRDTIVREYDVPPQQCEQDLLEFCQNLMDSGLIQHHPQETAQACGESSHN